MPQSLSIGNGNLSVNFGAKLQMQDFYFPFVGEENHIQFGEHNRVGIFVDNQISWLTEDPDWEFNVKYHSDSLVGNSTAENKRLNLKLRFEDFVYTTSNIFFRKVSVENNTNYDREIKIFFHHNFHIYGDKQQETAEFDPNINGVLHYRKSRYFFIGGQWSSGEGLSEFATGKADYQNHEGTFRDAEDGILSGHPIEQGSIDSTVGFYKKFKPGEKKVIFQWIVAGKNYHDITNGLDRISEISLPVILNHSRDYWKEWSNKSSLNFKKLSPKVENLYRRSLLLIRTQIDNRGAIIASTDSDIMKFNKDTYTYMWPRDGALVASVLADAGYANLSRKFLNFCEDVVSSKGFVLPKFTPSGNLGTSWHPRFKNGKKQLPIQEDESALILVALESFYKKTKSIDTVQQMFTSMVLRIGRFLIKFVDPKTGLPLPSYDLWEEKFGVFSYTAATVYGGLRAAANLSKITGHYSDQEVFEKAAQKMKKAIIKYLFSKEHNRFLKKVSLEDGRVCNQDPTVDASLSFIWEMGLLAADDKRVVSTMQAIEKELSVQTSVGGICRYPGDFYQRNLTQNYSENIPGNPWIITTLWLANWKIATAKNKKDLIAAKNIIEWAASQASSAGILPEQIDPFSGEPLSVAPLTWSHSTFVDSVQKFLKRIKYLK